MSIGGLSFDHRLERRLKLGSLLAGLRLQRMVQTGLRRMRRRVHVLASVLGLAVVNSARYRLSGLASEMAFNWMLAFFPLILTLLTAVGLFGSSEGVYQAIMGWFRQIAPTEPLTLVDNYVRAVSYGDGGGLFSISFVGAIWAASGALNAAMIALDLSHEVGSRVRRSFWQRRLLAIGLMVGMVLLTGAASGMIVFGGTALTYLVTELRGAGWDPLATLIMLVWRLLAWPLSMVLMVSACIIVYRSGPSRRRARVPVLPGAILASLLWMGMSLGFRIYITHFGNYNQVYGTVGAVIILLLWLWLSSYMLLFGDQINLALAEHQGLLGFETVPHPTLPTRSQAAQSAYEADLSSLRNLPPRPSPSSSTSNDDPNRDPASS